MEALAFLTGAVVLWLSWCYADQPFKPGGQPGKFILLCGAPCLLWILLGGLTLHHTYDPLVGAWLYLPLSIVQIVALRRATSAAIGSKLADKLARVPWNVAEKTDENINPVSWKSRWLWLALAWPSMAGSTFGRTFLYLPIIVGACVAFFSWFFSRTAQVEKDRPDLLAADKTYKAVKTVVAAPDGVLAGEINGQAVRISTEDRACVIGPPGTGKTAFLVSQLLDWANSGRSVVCLDIKPEIYGITRAALEAKGYRVLAYNPTARAGQRYNLLDDVKSFEGVGELAAALISSDGGDSKVFDENARDLVDGVLSHLRAINAVVSLPSFNDWIGRFDDVKMLLRELKKSPDPQVIQLANALVMTAQNERMLGSIFATLRANLRFLRYPAIRDSLTSSDFSLADLMSGKVALFLQFEESHQATTAQLFSVMIGHVLNYFMLHTKRQPILLLFDEIGNVPAIRGLAQKLNTIRSRHLPTWMYWQSTQQMQAYGVRGSGPDAILAACDFQMVFRLNDNETAAWMSEKIGTVDRLVRSISITYGGDNIFGQNSHSHSLTTEPVIFPHQLQALKNSEVVSTYRGLSWRGFATAYFQQWPQYRNCKPDACVGNPYSEQGDNFSKVAC